MQRAGVPDILVIVRGQTLFLELKAGNNEPTNLQIHTMYLIEQAGGTCRVVRTLQDAINAVNAVNVDSLTPRGKE